MTQDRKEWVRRAFAEAWAGNADEYVHEDYHDHNMAPGLPPTREGFKQMAAATLAAFPDFEVIVEEVLVDGDQVAVRVTNRGTHNGPFFGREPTGKAAQWTTMAIFRIADDKLVERWGVADVMGLFAQLGLLPGR